MREGKNFPKDKSSKTENSNLTGETSSSELEEALPRLAASRGEETTPPTPLCPSPLISFICNTVMNAENTLALVFSMSCWSACSTPSKIDPRPFLSLTKAAALVGQSASSP